MREGGGGCTGFKEGAKGGRWVRGESARHMISQGGGLELSRLPGP